jgi:hypothetical protein
MDVGNKNRPAKPQTTRAPGARGIAIANPISAEV